MAKSSSQRPGPDEAVPEEVKRRDRFNKIALVLVSLACITILVCAALKENVLTDWRYYQRSYAKILREKATDEWGKKLADDFEVEMTQIVLPTLGSTDRCITCHQGFNDPRMHDVPNPYAVHPGSHLKWHEPDKFGCTVCHQGQGLAVEKNDAHGRVEHWPFPLLTGEEVFTSCSRCHYENDLYGAEEDLYAAHQVSRPLDRMELTSATPGFENEKSLSVIRGKQLVFHSGCLGCHKYRGRGGALGPDISYVGDKSVHDFDFSRIEGPHAVSQWLFEHFRNPARVSPGTLMPDMFLTDRQARDLTNYMLSLHRKRMPADYTPMPPRRSPEPAEGRQLFMMFCSGCHGKDGQGSTVREYGIEQAFDTPPESMVPSLNNPDTLAVASDDYLRYIIEHGRDGTSMIGWTIEQDGGLVIEEIEQIVRFIRSWELPPVDLATIASSWGDAGIGRILYSQNCAACHGISGEGGIGTTLNSPGFLAIASDQFLARTLIHGRPNTAMPGWREFDSQRINDLIAFLRQGHPLRNEKNTVLSLLKPYQKDSQVNGKGTMKSTAVSIPIGKILYQANCVTCHGQSGQGDLAPSLSTQEFLSLVNDDYLYETLAHGRPGTGMPAWRHFTSEDIAALILYLDNWQEKERLPLQSSPIQGDWDAGRFLYAGLCVGCHGIHAEGGVGPQLSNPRFLITVNDTMLREWIAYGKIGTPMRGFLKGQQEMADLSAHQINNLVAYLRSLQREEYPPVAKYTSGRPELGSLWFAVSCASCHGPRGEGASGPSLANRSFLQAASTGYLTATLAMGRDGTEMRPVKKSPQSILSLSSDQVNDLVAYLRSWEFSSPRSPIAHNFVIPWDLAHGHELYQSHCAGCHGVNGKAELTLPGRLSAWAPELNNQKFLYAATDGFLQATIARGRTGTSMRAFGQGTQGMVDLSADDIDDIVAYIRRWSRQEGLPMTIPAESTIPKYTKRKVSIH